MSAGVVVRLLGAALLVVGIVAAIDVARRAAADEAPPAKPAASPAGDSAEETDPLGANAACYVCHMTFVKENLSKVHLAAKVGCVKCHGVSAKHANDEHIGATKPDRTYQRGQIDKACSACHPAHDVPARKVVARFEEQHLPASPSPVCTDCHGTHKIERESAPAAK
jgi:hypothetical protein